MIDAKEKKESMTTATFARQPVFDADRRLWGHELFCLGTEDATLADLQAGHHLASSLAAGVNIDLQQGFYSGTKILISFNKKDLLEKLPYVFPPELTVIMVSEDVIREESVFTALHQMKSDNYLVAADCFSGHPEKEAFYRIADVIVIDVCNRTRSMLTEMIERARPYSALILAHRVEDPARFNECLKIGYSLFHGPFFKISEKVTSRKFSSLEMSRFNLWKFIEQDQPDFVQLAETIQKDVAISYRLLSHLNSVAFGFPRKIQSIHQAILLLGWQKIKHWLRVVLLKDVSESKDASELILLSAQRGKILEQIAKDHDFWGFDPDGLYLLGMFSLLDVLLEIPMEDIVAFLPLETKLKTALCREKNNEFLPLLNLVQSVEEARWADAGNMITQLNLNSRKVKTAFQMGVNWAAELETVPA